VPKPPSGSATLERVSADYTPQDVAKLAAQGNVQVIDVRAPHEHEAGHIAGSRLIELGDLAAQADTIDRDTPVILYCRSGGRSGMATAALAQAGYDAHNMAGGMLDWHAAGLPMEPADGYVAEP
jgi:rhodanese-related sulfurtransferase